MNRRHISLLITLVGFCSASQTYAAAELTLPEELIGAAQGFLEERVQEYLIESHAEGRHEVQVKDLDPRLRLAACDRPLTVAQQGLEAPLGRVSVRVRCEGSTPWTVYIPAEVRLYRNVVVTTRPLLRDTIIDPQNVALLERDVGKLPQGYLTDIDLVMGQKLKRQVVADQILAPSFLQAAEVVRKGDQVVISAGSGGFTVRMQGEALIDGAQGEQIRVKNLNSKRVIKARVTGPGMVEVAM
ncbi:flagella basal body P-ring formation protein FlgA [Pseudomonas sp. LTJR-52]|uniref:flagellar basal body P-ring formation chaperone FlgA n=1 Tax=Pseudomonas sp. LTJR-52 TaxID=2479392 RepID=UPI000EFB47C8|nr:flagellar basal body P-ring formation chaperone FlgA [Pseudomonas sp. LTJR-52]AYN94993.1 flagella basal body P-ring formation protein FlgA [Pseudomonas sp. LTJR-52]